jgi:glycolate oxidase iron-sulfur subunit
MPERALLDDCVHCGFCLPACPTYRSWAQEMDSPRGRIDLMRGLADGSIALDASVVKHFDRCLGCMGCVPACPSGVKYDVLIEDTRAAIESKYQRPLLDRLHRAMVFALFPHPKRLKAVLPLLLLYARSGLQSLVRKGGLARVFPARLAQLEALLPSVEDRHIHADLPEVVPAAGPRRARVGLVAGCVQRVFFPEVNEATLRALSAEGCEVVIPKTQGCCGALSVHAGRAAESRRMARDLMTAFAPDLDAILVNAAGCGSHLKDYGRLFADDPALAKPAAAFAAKVKDVTEYLVSLGPVAKRHPLATRVAYHDACHLAHAQGIREAPRRLLAAIPELKLLEIPDGDQCCGSAGVYNLMQPESANEIGARKLENVLSTKPDLLASANPGCTLQIRKLAAERGLTISAAHPMEILAASLDGRPLS